VILDLLVELKKELGVAYLFITHDMTAAYHLSDQLAILDQGELVAQFQSKCNARRPSFVPNNW
ncbi:hypothetical protein ACWYRU_20390, partial [Bacillus pumilus]